MTSRPNILYLHSHDTGRCIQPSDHAVVDESAEGPVIPASSFTVR